MNTAHPFKHIRYWLKQKLNWLTFPISGGPLKGYRFGLFTSSRFLRGTYGATERQVMESILNKGDVVLDVGAHIGYFTLLASHTVSRDGNRAGRVFAFEPLPLNLAYLKRHLSANGIKNVKVYPAAVGLENGWQSFDLAGGSGRGSLSAHDGNNMLRVQVLRLDSLFEKGEISNPHFMKMDIEGAEGEALKGARNMLVTCRPTILLSVHGQAVQEECEAFLKDIGYRWSYVMVSTLLARHSDT